MTRVAPTILWADVHDRRLRVFRLGLESGNERVLGIHQHVVHFPFSLSPTVKFIDLSWRSRFANQRAGPEGQPTSYDTEQPE